MNALLKSGSKLEKVLDYLRREMVGSTLRFTIEHARQLMKEIDVKVPEQIWNITQVLEKKGLILRHKLPGKRGMDISFPDVTEKPAQVCVERVSRKVTRARITTHKVAQVIPSEKSLDHITGVLGEMIEVKRDITAKLISDAEQARVELEFLEKEYQTLVSAREIVGRRQS